jgi:hypothetical protein
MSDHSDSFHKSEEDVPPKVDPEAQADFDAEFEKHTMSVLCRSLIDPLLLIPATLLIQ